MNSVLQTQYKGELHVDRCANLNLTLVYVCNSTNHSPQSIKIGCLEVDGLFMNSNLPVDKDNVVINYCPPKFHHNN